MGASTRIWIWDKQAIPYQAILFMIMKQDCLFLKKTYQDTQGHAPACRCCHPGLSCEYAVLLDNKLREMKFDGGRVCAQRAVEDEECKVLKELVVKYPMVRHPDRLGNIDRKRVTCFAIAPAWCMSLSLAVRCRIHVGCHVRNSTPDGATRVSSCIPQCHIGDILPTLKTPTAGSVEQRVVPLPHLSTSHLNNCGVSDDVAAVKFSVVPNTVVKRSVRFTQTGI
ncbi:hypothetical protein YC2023_002709 [Brassica napus]